MVIFELVVMVDHSTKKPIYPRVVNTQNLREYIKAYFSFVAKRSLGKSVFPYRAFTNGEVILEGFPEGLPKAKPLDLSKENVASVATAFKSGLITSARYRGKNTFNLQKMMVRIVKYQPISLQLSPRSIRSKNPMIQARLLIVQAQVKIHQRKQRCNSCLHFKIYLKLFKTLPM
jgi:hypothetical protein